MTTEILFIGLQELGASLALALSQASVDTNHVGYDRSKDAARAAQNAGAVDKVVLDPFKAAHKADLVILALASGDAEAMLKDLHPHLKEGAALLDCSPLNSATMRWANENMEPNRHYIGAIPVLRHGVLHQLENDYQDARADLFEGSQLGLVIQPDTPESILNMSLNIAQAIGSDPFFLDAAETDAVASLIDTLPTTMGAALLMIASDSRGWTDIQRVAGRPFAASTYPAAGHDAAKLTDRLLDNQQSLVIHIDALIEKLQELQDMLAEGEREALEGRLGSALESRLDWLARREHGDWEAQAIAQSKVSSTGFLGNLFGITPRRRPEND